MSRLLLAALVFFIDGREWHRTDYDDSCKLGDVIATLIGWEFGVMPEDLKREIAPYT